MILDTIKEAIENAKDIIILTHENPDGDAVGSALAFYRFVKDLGKDVDVIVPNFPKVYEFLEDEDEFQPKEIRDGYMTHPPTNPEEVKIKNEQVQESTIYQVTDIIKNILSILIMIVVIIIIAIIYIYSKKYIKKEKMKKAKKYLKEEMIQEDSKGTK